MSYDIKRNNNYANKKKDSNLNQNINIVIDLAPKYKKFKMDYNPNNNFLFSKINVDRIPFKNFDIKKYNENRIRYRFFSLEKKCKPKELKDILIKKDKKAQNDNKCIKSNVNKCKNISNKNNYYINRIANKNNFSYRTPIKRKNSEKRDSTSYTTINDRYNYIYYKKPLEENLLFYSNKEKTLKLRKSSSQALLDLKHSSINNNFHYIKNKKKILRIQSFWRGRAIRKFLLTRIIQYNNTYILYKILKRIFFYHKKFMFQKFIFSSKYRELYFSKALSMSMSLKNKKKSKNDNLSYIKKKVKYKCQYNSPNKSKYLSCDNIIVPNDNQNDNDNVYSLKDKPIILNYKSKKIDGKIKSKFIYSNNIKKIIYKKINKTKNANNNDYKKLIELIISFIQKKYFLIYFPIFLSQLRLKKVYKEKENFNSFFNILESVMLKIYTKYFINSIKIKHLKNAKNNIHLININSLKNNKSILTNTNKDIKGLNLLILCIENIYKNYVFNEKKNFMNKIKSYAKETKIHYKKHIKLMFVENSNKKKDIIIKRVSSKKIRTKKIDLTKNKMNRTNMSIKPNNKSDAIVSMLLKLLNKIEIKTEIYHIFKFWKKMKNVKD